MTPQQLENMAIKVQFGNGNTTVEEWEHLRRLCESHAALLAACKAALDAIGGMPNQRAQSKLRAAIALAEHGEAAK